MRPGVRRPGVRRPESILLSSGDGRALALVPRVSIASGIKPALNGNEDKPRLRMAGEARGERAIANMTVGWVVNLS